MKNTEQQCNTCSNYLAVDETGGWCRAHPPVMIKGNVSCNPTVRWDSWCGEWRGPLMTAEIK